MALHRWIGRSAIVLAGVHVAGRMYTNVPRIDLSIGYQVNCLSVTSTIRAVRAPRKEKKKKKKARILSSLPQPFSYWSFLPTDTPPPFPTPDLLQNRHGDS